MTIDRVAGIFMGMTDAAGTSVAIIGAGRLGGALGYLLARAGYRIAGVAARSEERAAAAAAFIGSGDPTTDAARAAGGADIVLITTPDRSIAAVCGRIAAAGALAPGTIVAHASGAQTLDVLEAARRVGAHRAVLHPLQSVPSREQGVRNLPGAFFRIEADPPALAAVRALVVGVGGRELALPGWTPDPEAAAIYHAGAVVVSNYFVALVAHGLGYFQALGADRGEALAAVLPLIKGTLGNIETLGIPGALTGPVARGDVETVRGHVEALGRRAPHLLALYRELARATVAVARERGDLAPETAAALLETVRE
jgi:predicted short-subunit dehydrogenase-like oxidoreductase (DUF2520 family)